MLVLVLVNCSDTSINFVVRTDVQQNNFTHAIFRVGFHAKNDAAVIATGTGVGTGQISGQWMRLQAGFVHIRRQTPERTIYFVLPHPILTDIPLVRTIKTLGRNNA